MERGGLGRVCTEATRAHVHSRSLGPSPFIFFCFIFLASFSIFFLYQTIFGEHEIGHIINRDYYELEQKVWGQLELNK